MIPKSCRLFGQRSWAKSKRAEREANQAHSKLGASVARCPRTPPDAAKTPGLQIGLSNRLRGLSNRSIVVVCNYCSGPITAEPYRAKARPLRPRRSCFAPFSQRSEDGRQRTESAERRLSVLSAVYPPSSDLWWRRRVLPPGPNGLLRRPFIAIAGKPAPPI